MSRVAEPGLRPQVSLRLRSLSADPAGLARLLAIAAYFLLSLTGVTTSSIGMAHLTQEGVTSPPMFGEPRVIRSDEYNANTPIQLSILATGGAPTLSPLSEDAGLVQRFASGPVSSIVFFDNAILTGATFLPEAVRFAALWWLPVLVLVLALPAWFGALGLRRRWGWAAAGLVLATPAVAWWSMFPVRAVAYTLGGCALLLLGFKAWSSGRRLVGGLQLGVSGVLLAGFPSFYVPWSIVLGLPALAGSVLWIVRRSDVRWVDRLAPLAMSGGVAAALAAGLLWEFRDSLSALLSTVYPGSRRSGALAQPFDMLFGAAGLGPMADADPVGTNASELSTAYSVAFVLLAGVLVAHGSRWRSIDAATWSMIAFASVWLGWCTISLSGVGEVIPLLSSVPASRAGQVVGILAILSVCMVLGRLGGLPSRPAGFIAIGAGLVSGYATSLLAQGPLPSIRTRDVVLASVGTAAVAYLISRYGERHRWALGVAVLVAMLPVVNVNPLFRGLGDLRESETARSLAREGVEARADGSLWVADSGAFASVMLANGVPSLSGLQRSGPVEEQWRRIDPEGIYEEAWNRGGGYLGFAFESGSPWRVETDGFDQIWVTVDPCALSETFPEVSTIVSGADLQGGCLTARDVLSWAGQSFTVYSVAPAS